MAKLRADITMSLDGFVTGPNPGRGQGLGAGGEALHEWLVGLRSFNEIHGREGGETGAEDDLLSEAFEGAGSHLMGREMFDLAEAAWGDDPPFHAEVFVLTHEDREPISKPGGTTFHFVGDGIEAALEQARAAADRKDVAIAGGASVIRQYLAAGLLDEIQIHVAPMLLGSGTPLFDESVSGIGLELMRTVEGSRATHLLYRVLGRG